MQSSKQQGTHLACRECQRKKIKCDRTYPCLQCTRAGIQCKASTRKPRAKAGKTGDAELRERILKLERLVETFQGEDSKEKPRSSSNTIPRPDEQSTSPLMVDNAATSPASPSDIAALEASKYVAGNFWSSLTAEVKALADVFTEDGSNEYDDSPEDSPNSAQQPPEASQAVTADFELIFCPPGVLYIMPGAPLEPDPIMASQLLSAYLMHVEPMCTSKMRGACRTNAASPHRQNAPPASAKMNADSRFSQNLPCTFSKGLHARRSTISGSAVRCTL